MTIAGWSGRVRACSPGCMREGLSRARGADKSDAVVRIATWNVNSLRARLEKLEWWLERARPEVMLLQETKLADADVPVEPFARLGYHVAHHGEGRWNGVAIA